jgi:3-mercaptopyruvate sulfurtransferase SseA
MSLILAFVKRTVVCLIALALVYVVPTLANPNNYPQFAQQGVDPTIPIFFTGVEHVKAQLDAGHPPVLVDVRSAEEYNAGHIPRAKSIPLEVLPRRMAEIPRDIPVVLY